MGVVTYRYTVNHQGSGLRNYVRDFHLWVPMSSAALQSITIYLICSFLNTSLRL